MFSSILIILACLPLIILFLFSIISPESLNSFEKTNLMIRGSSTSIGQLIFGLFIFLILIFSFAKKKIRTVDLEIDSLLSLPFLSNKKLRKKTAILELVKKDYINISNSFFPCIADIDKYEFRLQSILEYQKGKICIIVKCSHSDTINCYSLHRIGFEEDSVIFSDNFKELYKYIRK